MSSPPIIIAILLIAFSIIELFFYPLSMPWIFALLGFIIIVLMLGKIKNNKMVIFFIFVVFILFFILAIYFPLLNIENINLPTWLYYNISSSDFREINHNMVTSIDNNNSILNVNVITSNLLTRKDFFDIIGGTLSILGGAIGGYFIYSQIKQKDKHFKEDTQFKNFLEATKMLTDKESTIEAKVSALYLLLDIAKSHPDNIGRIIQVINKQLTPLVKCIEGNCETKPYSKTREKVVLYKHILNRKITTRYIENDLININIKEKNKTLETIKEWKYKGNDTEKLIATSLHVLKAIVLKATESNEVDFNNTIIFNIDNRYNTDYEFMDDKKPIENLIFLDCNFDEKEQVATNRKYHRAIFMNCDLKGVDFSNSDLWGSSFINCNLKGAKFKNTECEAVEFKDCKEFTDEQINKMKFEKIEKLKNKYEDAMESLNKGNKDESDECESLVNKIKDLTCKDSKKLKLIIWDKDNKSHHTFKTQKDYEKFLKCYLKLND